MNVLAFDTETWLIAPGLLAPPLVTLQWARRLPDGVGVGLVHRAMAEGYLREWLAGDEVLVGHNVAYDMGVIAAAFPSLLPAIFAKYDRDQVTDTKIREQLVMISRGTFRSMTGADGEMRAVKYGLDECCHRHFGRRLSKEGWRFFYRVFDEHEQPSYWHIVAKAFQDAWRRGERPEWCSVIGEKDIAAMLASEPDEAVRYALEDGKTTLALYESQERHFGAGVTGASGVFRDEYRQARAAFALHLSSAWGLYTDPKAVDALETQLLEQFEALKEELQREGLIRPDGTADTAKAKAAMVAACEEDGVEVWRTKGGDISLSADACDRFDETSIVGQYSRFLTLRKTLSNDIEMLRTGCDVPIQPRYDLADTGRTRAAAPNIQAINRGAGIREAFRPRPGSVFIQADFEGLELHTLAAWCLECIGWSKLADDLNAGKDVHTAMAAELLAIPYEDAMARKEAKDKEIKEYRQRAKALNFGLPGGLGVKKFVRYAKASYGVDVSEEQARAYKAAWMQRQPEMVEYFALAARATANPAGLANEEHIFTGRQRGNVRYSALCNGRFQGLGADAAKEALWRVTRACYADPASPLYGCRPVAFIHDEIIAEAPDDARAAQAAAELGRLMCEGANAYLSKVPVRVAPLIMRVWSKSAEPTYREGKLIPWEPEKKAS